MATACTRTRTSPGPGAASDSVSIVSGAPNARHTAAWIVVVLTRGHHTGRRCRRSDLRQPVDQGVLNDLAHRRVDPILAVGDGVGGLTELHRLHERLDEDRRLGPDD